ncbi:major facilitator superfamily MFS_1 [Sphingobium chlorophenolicum L-1]|uniref:Major facilitator superfamily MFS_1 n=2 Tax=Sphingobium chlorophenolicum TaxID=46429 RepID=F6F1L2_SPHCR|nr:MFS transporter [Sphingobium chlorophenolicum]AEG51428.1 major facilitator superfamily MFS_1 [Sphingobium chlorophenolicum L-1]KEQ53528.1 Major facilitator superfamily MFS_1 [Sphingobium chlorophenolicum]
MRDLASDSASRAYGGRTALFAIALLTMVSFFNYMDRMVLAVVLEPIKRELGLSDAQLGLLSGVAFAVVYASMGIPLGRLADRTSRTRLLAACLGVWSVMTFATGLARNFSQLFLARVGVGIGEAGCAPAAHSLIGDYFPAHRRALGISFFQAGGIAGVSIGLMVAGLIAHAYGWRAALMVAGLASLPLLVLLLMLPEPVRGLAGHGQDNKESLWATLGILLRRRAFLHLNLGLGISSFGIYGIGQWQMTFLVRSMGLDLRVAGFWSGLAHGTGGIIGVIGIGALTSYLMRRDPRWELWIPTIGYSASAPVFAAAFLCTDWRLCIALLTAGVGLSLSTSGVALSALQSFAEPWRRGTAVAIALFTSAMIGLGLGPYTIGMISDFLRPTQGDESLRYALFISCASLAWAGWHFMLATRSAAKDRI